MKVPVLQSCCGCVSLRRGTVAIAVIRIMFEITCLIGTLSLKRQVASFPQNVNGTEAEGEEFLSIFLDEWTSNSTSEIVGTVVTVALSALLLLGVYYRHEKMFLLWLAVEAFVLALLLIGLIVVPILVSVLHPNANASVYVWIVVIYATIYAITAYCYMVVFSYYREVKVENKGLERGTQLENLNDEENQ